MVPPRWKFQLSGQDASARTHFHDRSVTEGPLQGSVTDLREMQGDCCGPGRIFKDTPQI